MQRLTNLITNTMDDMFLLQLIKNGDKQAFKYVFDTYFTALCRFMYLYLGDTQEAEDIASDIFASVWENRKKLEIRLTFKAYLFQAAKNRCLNAIRDRKATVSLDDINGQDTPQVSITDSLETEELNNLIQEAILSLPEKCREVFLQSRTKNLTNQEIAESMDISVKTVEAQITKALKQIRKFLGTQYQNLFNVPPQIKDGMILLLFRQINP